MRKLMWFTIGFAAGCIPVAYWLWDAGLVTAGILCGVIGIALCCIKPKPSKVAGILLLGFALSAIWNWGINTFYLDTARLYHGNTVITTIEAADYSRQTDYSVSVDGKIILSGKTYNTRVYLKTAENLAPGDKIRGEFYLSLSSADPRRANTYQSDGTFILAYAKGDVTVIACEKTPLRYYPTVLRRQILENLDASFSSDTAGFSQALLLGESEGLTYEEDTAFKVSGVRHVIAVSGLHVSILFALVYMLCGKRRVLTALVGIPALFLFAAAAGFSPSIVRACIMQCLMILAMLVNKEYDPPTALSFSVLVLLLWNPMTIASISFQLSVGCMVGIFLFCRRLTDYLLRLLRCPKGTGYRVRLTQWFAGSVAVTLSAMSVTTPLSAVYFGMISIVGVLTNLLTLWIISFVFYGIMVTCLLSAVWPALGDIAGWLIGWLIRYVLWMSDRLSRLPMASVYTCSVYIVLWCVFAYGVFVLLLLAKKKRPVLAASCIFAGLLLSIFASWLEPRLDGFRVTVIDVGQGQSILLQSDGKNYLVDCGGDSPEYAADTVAACLFSQGIYRLDGIVITHYDVDHAAAVPYLLTRVDADALFLPDIPDDAGIKDEIWDNHSHLVRWVTTQICLAGDWGTLTMIPGGYMGKENEISMCILFQAKECDILITGDRSTVGERKLLDSYALPELELLIVGHHGSGDASGFELLSTTKPKTVAISVGKDNPYGHPAPQVLDRLKQLGCRILRTDRDGTIVFRR